MIMVYDVMVKSDKENNIWETKKMFDYTPEGGRKALQFGKSLENDGYDIGDVSVTISKIETVEEIVQKLTDLFYSSQRLSHLIGEDVLLKAFNILSNK